MSWSDYNRARALGCYVTSRSRCAARYAALVGCSIYEASKEFDVSAGGVWHAWSKIYPGVPHPTSMKRRRVRCSACGRTGHLALHGRCSPSEIARRMLAGGATAREAADHTGITTAAVYAAREWQRRAA